MKVMDFVVSGVLGLILAIASVSAVVHAGTSPSEDQSAGIYDYGTR